MEGEDLQNDQRDLQISRNLIFSSEDYVKQFIKMVTRLLWWSWRFCHYSGFYCNLSFALSFVLNY